MASVFMEKLAAKIRGVGPASKKTGFTYGESSRPVSLADLFESASVPSRKTAPFTPKRKSDVAFVKKGPKSPQEATADDAAKKPFLKLKSGKPAPEPKTALASFRAAFEDELGKIAEDDSTSKSVKRGAKIGAIGLGAVNFIRGLLAGARKRGPLVTVTRDGVPSEYHAPKAVRMGALGAGLGLHGAVRGALLGGAVGFLRRKKGARGAKDKK